MGAGLASDGRAVRTALYPGANPQHYGTALCKHAILGGYLNGYSFYTSPHGYCHLVSHGMTVLYTDEAAFGGKGSGWGYEITMKLADESENDSMRAIGLLVYLARDTYTTPQAACRGANHPA